MQYTVTEVYKSEYRIKGSRFISFITNSETPTDTERFLASVKNEHPTATHHCYACLMNPNDPAEVVSDDGEPGGTAGLPILNALKSAGLMNTLIVVVRYYGGTKLGKSGLIDAYSTTAEMVIQSAVLKKMIPILQVRVGYRYENQSFINKLKNDYPLIEMNANYTESVELLLGIPKKAVAEVTAKLKAAEHLLLCLEEVGESFYILKD